MKKLLVIIILTIVLIVIAISVGLWLSLAGFNPEINVTSGTDHILEWKERTTTDTRLGTVTGLSNGRVNAFLGLRYAQPPTGERRFLPPVASLPWEGTHEATVFPSIAMQEGDATVSKMSEDCLFLNIYTPANKGNPRPVLFWIHGGGLKNGSGNDNDGSVLAEQGDVVVVAINYRLGLFGNLDLSKFGDEFAGSASNGFRDQILALEWVRDNIADYGGDPDNVTIFGESAGGQSVFALMASPSADGLYHKAFSHSGPGMKMAPMDVTPQLAGHLKVDESELVEALRALPAKEVVAALKAIDNPGIDGMDGHVITRSIEDAILNRGADGVPLIAGSNKDEGTFFAALMPPFLYGLMQPDIARSVNLGADPTEYLERVEMAYPDDTKRERFIRVWTHLFRRPALIAAASATAAGPGGWVFRFDFPSTEVVNEVEVGATHTIDIPFTFNSFADENVPVPLLDKDDPVVQELALNWSNTIIQFARTGNPNGAGLPEWPRYSTDDRRTLIVDANSRVEANLDVMGRKMWGDE